MRRAVYTAASDWLRDARLPVPPEANENYKLSLLFWRERDRLANWLRDRGRGVRRAPPGGVGGRR